jgi:hypothetical protein
VVRLVEPLRVRSQGANEIAFRLAGNQRNRRPAGCLAKPGGLWDGSLKRKVQAGQPVSRGGSGASHEDDKEGSMTSDELTKNENDEVLRRLLADADASIQKYEAGVVPYPSVDVLIQDGYDEAFAVVEEAKARRPGVSSHVLQIPSLRRQSGWMGDVNGPGCEPDVGPDDPNANTPSPGLDTVTLPRDRLRELFARCRREYDEWLVDSVSEEYQRGLDDGAAVERSAQAAVAGPLRARIAELEAQLGAAKTPPVEHEGTGDKP